MLRLIIRLVVRAGDEVDLADIAAELKRRIENPPPLQADKIKVMAVTSVETDQ